MSMTIGQRTFLSIGMVAITLIASLVLAVDSRAGAGGSESGSRSVTVPNLAPVTLFVDCSDYDDPNTCTEHQTPSIMGATLTVEWLATGQSNGVTHDEAINPSQCTSRGMRGAGIRVISNGGNLLTKTTVRLDFADESREDKSQEVSRSESRESATIVERVICLPLA